MSIVDESPSHSLTLRSKTGFLADDGKPEVNCCYPAFVLRTRIGGQKMPIAGTPASGSVAQGRG
ncbi:MAG: hypothetical protein WAO10_09005, partial [Candidatus Sulfotelmatobacter sp.]